jgi:hydrocephalus-inducing protein
MTSPGQPHEGSVFLPIPDGTGLLYKLSGIATAPQAEAAIERQVGCLPSLLPQTLTKVCPDSALAAAQISAKQAHVEVLRATNWLGRQQRFRVQVERKQVGAGVLGSRQQLPSETHKIAWCSWVGHHG